MTLVRATNSIVWELRGAWATGRRVALSLDERCCVRRVEGFVERVAGTGATVRVAGWHIPADAILAVHLPSRLGDSTVKGGPWHGPPRQVIPQEEQLPGYDEVAA